MRIMYVSFCIQKGNGGSLGSKQNLDALKKIFRDHEFHEVHVRIPEQPIAKVIFYLSCALRGYYRKLEIQESDLVIFDSIYLVGSAKRWGEKRILFSHNFEPEYLTNEFKWLKKFVMIRWFKKCISHLCEGDLVIVTNPRDQKLCFENLKIKARVVLPGFEMNFKKAAHGEIKIRNVGFLCSNSTQNLKSLRMIGQIASINPSIFFHIFGRLPNVASIKFPENVVFMGFVDDLRKSFREMDVSIAPILEPAGIKMKIIEALSYGLPVFSTPAGLVSLPTDVQNLSLIHEIRDPTSFIFPDRVIVNESDFDVIYRYFSEKSKEEALNAVFLRS